MSELGNAPLPSVSESPWFWVMLFSLAGLAAVATIGPKFERREQSIETKFHARERGLGREAVEPAADGAPAQAPQWEPIFTLGPIAAALGLVAVVAMVNLYRLQHRRMSLMQRSDPHHPPANPGAN